LQLVWSYLLQALSCWRLVSICWQPGWKRELRDGHLPEWKQKQQVLIGWQLGLKLSSPQQVWNVVHLLMACLHYQRVFLPLGLTLAQQV